MKIFTNTPKPISLSPCFAPYSNQNPALHLPARLHWSKPTGSEPAPRRLTYRPGTINLRSSAFICGLVSGEAPEINCSEFIKIRAAQNSSPQSHHIPPTSSSKHSNLLSERRINAARKTKYAFLQLFNSKIDKTGDNENI